jgi:hypothetical protein
MTTAPDIEFDESTHTYRVNGQKVISVTQAIDEGGFGDWKKFVDQMDLAYAQQLGTAVHSAIELYEEGTLDTAPLDPLIEPRVDAYEKFKRECDVLPVELEQVVYNPIYGYCGRLDFRGRVHGDRAIVDFKSGVVDHVVAVQLAGYAGCMDDPATYARYSLQLKDDGTYRLHEYPRADYRTDFNVFLSALAVAKFKRSKNLR